MNALLDGKRTAEKELDSVVAHLRVAFSGIYKAKLDPKIVENLLLAQMKLVMISRHMEISLEDILDTWDSDACNTCMINLGATVAYEVIHGYELLSSFRANSNQDAAIASRIPFSEENVKAVRAFCKYVRKEYKVLDGKYFKYKWRGPRFPPSALDTRRGDATHFSLYMYKRMIYT